MGTLFEAASDDDGYVSPEFDLPEQASDEDEFDTPPPSKRGKFNPKAVSLQPSNPGLDDEEELALRLLGKR